MIVNLNLMSLQAPGPPFGAVSSRFLRFWQQSPVSDEARPVAQRLAVEARHLLVAVEDGLELGGRHDVLDAGERLAAGAGPDLAQDGVGRVAAVGQHDLGRRRSAYRLV